MTIGPPIPETQFDLENSRSNVSSIGPTIPKIWRIGCATWETDLKFYEKIALKHFMAEFPKFKQVDSMMREIYLPSFVAIGWAVLTWSWWQGKLRPASAAEWPWPNVTDMGANNFSHTHSSTMCGLKKSVSGVFPETWKVLAERRRRRKRPKNNTSPGYQGWLNECSRVITPLQ